MYKVSLGYLSFEYTRRFRLVTRFHVVDMYKKLFYLWEDLKVTMHLTKKARV